MDSSALAEKAVALLPFTPNEGQKSAIDFIAEYICNAPSYAVAVLNGYAGTGKTSVLGAVIKALESMKVHTVLLAPTGRAAKVAALMSNGRSSTIHRRIYRPDLSGSETRYCVTPNRQHNTVFVVDEASLISDGAGRSLLRDFLSHVFASSGCRIIFSGDTAQLPPIGQSDSPAMNPERLRSMGLEPYYFSLDLPVRQKAFSGILENATMVRQFITKNTPGIVPSLQVGGFGDVEAISSADLADRLAESWSAVGVEETLIITRSNHRANNYNKAVRNMVMYAESPLQAGDRLVISKNDYYWSKINRLHSFVANGDIAEVTHVGAVEKAYGRYFADVELQFPADGSVLGGKLMLRSLVSDGPSIPTQEMNRFFQIVYSESEGAESEKLKAALESPYFNAIQAKYAYCVTCHKSQGGQWKHIYIDMAGIDVENLTEDFYRWLYTAITRATEKVFFINSPLPVE